MKTFLLLFLTLLNLCILQKPNITSYGIRFTHLSFLEDNRIMALAFPNGNSNVQKLFLSQDDGRSFNDITYLLEGYSYPDNPILNIYPSPVKNSAIYVQGITSSWITEDAGTNFQKITFTDLRPRDGILWHPLVENWGLGFTQETSQTKTIFLTSDFGRSWSVFARDIIGYSWGDSGVNEIKNERVYVLIYNSTTNSYDFNYSDDFGKSWITEIGNCGQFLFLGEKIFAAVKELSTSNYILKVSPGFGKTYRKYYDAKFPFGDELNSQNQYSILDDSTGAIYLGLHSRTRTEHWGNVFVSDATGAKYNPNIEHVHDVGVIFDFDRVQSIEGFYLANVLQNYNEEYPKVEYIKTRYTFDNGVTWRPLTPPHFDSQGQPTCQEGGECFLHLHSWSEFTTDSSQLFGPFISAPNAVGLVIGTGNIGEYLSNDISVLSTFLTRDGGLTWTELIKKNTIYDFADHGGIIVMTPFDESTTTAYYTLDEGHSVQSVEFSPNKLLNVTGVISRPLTNTRTIFILARDPLSEERYVFSLDFSTILSTPCTQNDYQDWSPDNGERTDGGKCVLGRTITYRRKIPTAECYNTNPEIETKITNCTCTEDDWECDFDYKRAENGTCISNKTQPNPPTDCIPGQNYYISKGYQKVPGNSCQGGVDYSPNGPFVCPDGGKHGKTSNTAWIVVLVVFFTLCFCTIGSYLFLRFSSYARSIPHNPFQKLHTDDMLGDEELYREPSESGLVDIDLDDKSEENNFNPNL